MLSRFKAMVRRLLGRSPSAAAPVLADPTPPRLVQVRRLDAASLADQSSVTAFRASDGAWVAQMKDAEVLVVDGAFYIVTPEGTAFGSGGAVEIDLTRRPSPWRVLEPTVLIGGNADEARWREALTKVGVWRRSGLGTDLMVRFLVHADITPDQIDRLSALGVETDRIVRADPHSIRRFDKLLVPSIDQLDRAGEFLRAMPPAGPAPEVDSEPTLATLGRFPSLAGRF